MLKKFLLTRFPQTICKETYLQALPMDLYLELIKYILHENEHQVTYKNNNIYFTKYYASMEKFYDDFSAFCTSVMTDTYKYKTVIVSASIITKNLLESIVDNLNHITTDQCYRITHSNHVLLIQTFFFSFSHDFNDARNWSNSVRFPVTIEMVQLFSSLCNTS